MSKLSLPKATFEEKFNDFVDFKRMKGVSEPTVRTYRSHSLVFFKAVDKNTAFEKVNFNKIISYIQSEDISPNSKASYLRVLRTFMVWAGFTDNLPVDKEPESIKEPYTDEELKLLLKQPSANCSFTEYRTWCIELLVLDTGMRSSSIRNIKTSDVIDKTVIVRHAKNGRPQVLPFGDITAAALNKLIRMGNEYLFCDCYGKQLSAEGLKLSVRKYNQKRGVNKTSLHLLRHTFARKYLLECNGDAFKLQKMLNHSTLQMVKHYCRIYDKDLIDSYQSPVETLHKNKIKF